MENSADFSSSRIQQSAQAQKIQNNVLDVGFGNTVPRQRVIGIVSYDSDPLRRQCQELEKMHRVIDATRGRKVKSVVFLDSSHVVLSAVARETLSERFNSLGI